MVSRIAGLFIVDTATPQFGSDEATLVVSLNPLAISGAIVSGSLVVLSVVRTAVR